MIEHQISFRADVPLPESVSQATVSALVNHVLAREGVDDPWQVGVQFVDDTTMQAAHLEYMNIDEPTDIMTFPYAEDDDVWGENDSGGDLIISLDTARENAIAAGWSATDELFFLVTHGLLHLLGWDDHTPEDRDEMLAHQHELLTSWTGRP